ncbi:MAG: FUSC family protein [Solimonas sp.]
MRFLFITPKNNALLYAVKILTGSLLLWFGLRAAGIEQPYWAIISLITVTEPDITQAKDNFRARIINTLTGTVIACITLVVAGPGFVALMVAVSAAVLLAMFVQNYPANWRLAPVTVVVVISAAVNGNGLHAELDYALLRVAEVLAGSLLALLQSLAYGTAIERWLGRPVSRPPPL